MSLNIYELSYVHPDREVLFENAALSLGRGEKASLIGNNGSGKSTLLRIAAGLVPPSSGSVAASATPYYVPQHFGQYNSLTIAAAMGAEGKLSALEAITAGDLSDANYALLGEEWDIDARVAEALATWGLGGYVPARRMDTLSGGEKTKVFMAGIELCQPQIILLDEPTNHLDRQARQMLYDLITRSRATMLVVSHDRTLLGLLDTTYELTPKGINRYGGNYEFYKAQRDGHLRALEESVAERQKALRRAQAVAGEAAERKRRADARGRGKMKREGVPRIMLKTIADTAQSSGKRLREVHERRIESISGELARMKERLPDAAGIKVKLSGSGLHSGKTLVAADGINFGYAGETLWPTSLSFRIASGDRIVVRGANGSGKSTLICLILGLLRPSAGAIACSPCSRLYIDQEYSLIDNSLTVIQHVERHNLGNLPGHILRTELHRFRFPAETWDKPCSALSGGEKMKLILCCLLIGNSSPDLFILDEPTNNLDIQSLEIVTRSLREYRGTLIVVSHDDYFLREVGITHQIELQRPTPSAP